MLVGSVGAPLAAIAHWQSGPIWRCHNGPFARRHQQTAKPDQVVAIVKAREPARILVAIGAKDNDSPHLEFKQRWVNQFNFYLNDKHWGRIFVLMGPYFPFSARVCLNQHHWLAIRMQEEGIHFQLLP